MCTPSAAQLNNILHTTSGKQVATLEAGKRVGRENGIEHEKGKGN